MADALKRLGDRDQVALPGARLDDDPLVQQDVLLQPSLEGVAEGGVGPPGDQGAVVRLHQATLPDAMVLDPGPDGHDPARHLVAGHGGLGAGDVAAALLQDFGADPGRISSLRGWSENCFRSLTSEKQRPTDSTFTKISCGPG